MQVTALLTCHNRRALTLTCLERLLHQDLPAETQLHVVLVDDGSTDGTADAVREAFPAVRVLEGPGNLYWCGGMRVAWREASLADPDFYLLLNDDTIMCHEALSRLLVLAGGPGERVIAVGTILDTETGLVNYGAVHSVKGLLSPADLEEGHTFNANCVVVTRAVFQELGMFHHGYTHAMGDTDYGIQATIRGILIRKSGKFVGSCDSNPVNLTWRDRNLSRKRRWQLLQHPKGLPFKEWCTFCRRNYGILGPYRLISPMLRILAGR